MFVQSKEDCYDVMYCIPALIGVDQLLDFYHKVPMSLEWLQNFQQMLDLNPDWGEGHFVFSLHP
jgi:hypothetical protein